MGAHRDNDASLLRAVARGDQAALTAYYDRNAGWLLARLSRRCDDPETVRDVLQDTFIAVWQSAGSFKKGEDSGGWLWVIAMRRLVDTQRVRTRTERVRYELPVAAPSAEERVLAGLEYGDVGTALDRISPELRAVLRATVIDGMTTREAAQVLDVPEGTVKTRAIRARRELRAVLAQLAKNDEPLGGLA